MERIRAAVREILIAVGENPDREGLLDTPDRVARMYAELFAGLHDDPRRAQADEHDDDQRHPRQLPRQPRDAHRASGADLWATSVSILQRALRASLQRKLGEVLVHKLPQLTLEARSRHSLQQPHA